MSWAWTWTMAGDVQFASVVDVEKCFGEACRGWWEFVRHHYVVQGTALVFMDFRECVKD